MSDVRAYFVRQPWNGLDFFYVMRFDSLPHWWHARAKQFPGIRVKELDAAHANLPICELKQLYGQELGA